MQYQGRAQCLVTRSKIIEMTSMYADPFDNNKFFYTFHVDIGEQTPALGHDPEFSEKEQYLTEIRWMALDEISEKDRAHLWASGLLSIREFWDEMLSFSREVSYPGKREL